MTSLKTSKPSTDTQTLLALLVSIKKWEKICDGTGADRGTSNCALCEMFWEFQYCNGCPVAEKGYSGCQGTPYEEWYKKKSKGGKSWFPYFVENIEEKLLAEAELSFLKSLLPPRSEWPYAAILIDRSTLGLLERIRRIAEREVENDTTALSALATIADLVALAQKELSK